MEFSAPVLKFETGRLSRLLAGCGILFLIALYFFFYPPLFAFRDESDYLAMAYVFRHGTAWIDAAGIPVRSVVQAAAGHLASDYAPGMPLLLLPWTFCGWKAVFLCNFFFHAAGGWIFWKLLNRFGSRDPFWVLLYLFYPPFLLFSRTIMADIPASVLFLAGCLAYCTSGKFFWAGVSWGAAAALKETQVVFILPFLAGALFRSRKDFAQILLGLLPFAAALAVYNAEVFGRFWHAGYANTMKDIDYFSPAYFPARFRHYLSNLMFVYPLMAAAPFFCRKIRRPEIWISASAGIVFFSFYFYYDRFAWGLATDIFGARFLFPAASFLIAAYALCLEAWNEKLPETVWNAVKIVLAAALMICGFFVFKLHQAELQKQADMKALIYGRTEENSVLLYDGNTAELIQNVWGARDYHEVPKEDWRQVLGRRGLKRPVYAAVRNQDYAGEQLTGFGQALTEDVAAKYPVHLIGESHGLRLYQIDAAS